MFGPQKVERTREEQDRSMGEDNIPLPVVAERMALTRARELWLQNLVLHRSVVASLTLRFLQLEWKKNLSIL